MPRPLPPLALLLVLACSEEARPPGEAARVTGPAGTGTGTTARPAPVLPSPAWLHPEGSIVLDAVDNPGFELVADATTSPPKYGAYWLGAFSPEEGDSHDLVEAVDDAFAGRRVLRLRPADGTVTQKLVADERWTHELELTLAVRLRGGAALRIELEDGHGERLEMRLDDELLAPGEHRTLRASRRGPWTHVTLAAGAVARQLDVALQPRLLLHLSAEGPDGASVEVDEVHAATRMPLIAEAKLAHALAELVKQTLEDWYTPREQGGLGLVDPKTGWITALTYDVETGETFGRPTALGLHSIHDLLLRWVEYTDAQGWDDESRHWSRRLERLVATLLTRHFDPDTQLPRTLRPDGTPLDDSPVTVGSYVDVLLDAAPLLREPALREGCLSQARRTADALVALQQAHDLGPDRPNALSLDQTTGRLEGETDNWYGAIPPKLTPKGEIDPPRRFNSSWAILTGRTFWYHLLRSPAAVARVWNVRPAPGDLEAVARALARFERPWDASRYDLENDTDDHYGYLMEDGLAIVRAAGRHVPRARALVQEATDYRLPRRAPDGEAAGAGESLWIQGVRLGSACAGDSPRAFAGVVGLLELPGELAPDPPAASMYRAAVRELAWNDFKGRQLTNGQFTESFFEDWEMVCICYRGTYQGDCRERPADWWHGDVGDIFGGPPAKAIEALAHGFAVADATHRPALRAAMATIRDVTEATLRREHGYLFGLDEAVARQYELPDKYVLGLQSRSLAGLGHVLSWMKLLPRLDLAAIPPTLELRREHGRPVLHGPPGHAVRVIGGAAPHHATRAGPDDRRLLALDPRDALVDVRVELDPVGRAFLGDALAPLAGRDARLQCIVTAPDGTVPLVSEAVSLED